MASHRELVAELSKVNNMSTDERLRYAQQRRAEQLARYAEYENEEHLLQNGDEHKNGKAIKFKDSITLLEACARNDYDEVKLLLSQNVCPNETNEDGLTALHQACIDNFEDIVELLLDYKADINAVDSEFWTPLHAACTCGHTAIAQILVARSADLLAINADQNMPYDICEEDSTLQFIEQAMAKKGITQEQINKARCVRENQIITDLREYVESGGDVDSKDNVGATLLHVAAANGYLELTKTIIGYGADVNVQDNDGWSPLHAAACWCQLEVVEILGVQNNADPTVKNKLNEIPVDVTEDAEVKALLQKLTKAYKERKKPKVLSGLRRKADNSAGTRGVSGIRGQSFKGRSKRDKKNGISAVEAKSESEYWHKGQETSISTAKKSFKFFTLPKFPKSLRRKDKDKDKDKEKNKSKEK